MPSKQAIGVRFPDSVDCVFFFLHRTTKRHLMRARLHPPALRCSRRNRLPKPSGVSRHLGSDQALNVPSVPRVGSIDTVRSKHPSTHATCWIHRESIRRYRLVRLPPTQPEVSPCPTTQPRQALGVWRQAIPPHDRNLLSVLRVPWVVRRWHRRRSQGRGWRPRRQRRAGGA